MAKTDFTGQSHLCSVYEMHPLDPPHRVCRLCYEQAKAIYVRPRAYWEQHEEKNWESRGYVTPSGKAVTPEIMEHNIVFAMTWEADRWTRWTEGGLSAVLVIIEAVDDAMPDVVFHRRRIAFMRDLVDRLNPELFLPAVKVQIDDFMQSATDFWNGEISEDERKRIYQHFNAVMPDKTPTDWTAKSIVHWMMHLQDYFDWMWYQWMESVYDAISVELPDAVWIMLFKKHFADENAAWPRKAEYSFGISIFWSLLCFNRDIADRWNTPVTMIWRLKVEWERTLMKRV